MSQRNAETRDAASGQDRPAYPMPVADCEDARVLVFDYEADGRFASVYVTRAVFDAIPGRVTSWSGLWSKKASKRVTFFTREGPVNG